MYVGSCVEARAVAATPTAVVASWPIKWRQPAAGGLRGPDHPLALGRVRRPRGSGPPMGVSNTQSSLPNFTPWP